ncbi:hypothetical protein [Pectobacterium carotovorum]|uniref:Uncharacterized protein n=1 Tax=Pectobacterium carotovorum TaxID=554 RepID=A0A419AVM2_PECCA|nr:hypothetical protein [Pectobacterium carotovorum]RJL50883.1 hypothetical protein D5071_12655 [Pectobacterium carotovorum]
MNLLRSGVLIGATLTIPFSYAVEHRNLVSNTLLNSGENQIFKIDSAPAQYGPTLVADKKEAGKTVLYPIKNGVEITAKDLSKLFENNDLVVINVRDGQWVPAIHTPDSSGYQVQKAINISNTSSPSSSPVELYVNGEKKLINSNRGAYVFSENGSWNVAGLQP